MVRVAVCVGVGGTGVKVGTIVAVAVGTAVGGLVGQGVAVMVGVGVAMTFWQYTPMKPVGQLQ